MLVSTLTPCLCSSCHRLAASRHHCAEADSARHMLLVTCSQSSFSKINNQANLRTGHASLDLYWQWAISGSDQHEQRTSLCTLLPLQTISQAKKKVTDYILKLTGTMEQDNPPALSSPGVLHTLSPLPPTPVI